MIYLIKRDQRNVKDTDLVDWSESLRTAYCCGSENFQPCVDIFKTAFSLFPIIRAIEKNSRLHPDDNSKTIAIFSALITDRGLLAEQTRDAAMYGEQSRISTVLTYIPKPIPKERHQRCVNKALMAVQPLWKGYFQNRCGYDRFGLLLDSFYQQCVHRRKTVGSSVRFPCDHILDCHCEKKRFKKFHIYPCRQCAPKRKCPDTLIVLPYKCFCIDELNQFRNDDICPDKQEIAFAEHTQIVISYESIVPAITYYKELAEREGIGTFNDDELVFFVRKILLAYCRYEKLWCNHKSEKQYNAKIIASDINKLQQQAEDAMNIYLRIMTTQPIPRAYRKHDEIKVNEDRIKCLTDIFIVHDIACASCRCQNKDTDEIDVFCYKFAFRLDADWKLLRGNPFLIFRL